MDDASVDAVVTDPPYMIGSISTGDPKSKAGSLVDLQNSAFWYKTWISESLRILKPTGFIFVFSNWRSIPIYTSVSDSLKCKIQSCLVWDKEWIGPAGKSQLRPTFEIAVLFGKSEKSIIHNRSASDIYRCKWMAAHSGITGHPAEKPVELMQHMCRLVTPPDGIVLDPFCGSGSTCVAAVREGFQFIGIEANADYVEIANARIRAESQFTLA
jgi:DNA modification methylase